jgi:hypothetical protein
VRGAAASQKAGSEAHPDITQFKNGCHRFRPLIPATMEQSLMQVASTP